MTSSAFLNKNRVVGSALAPVVDWKLYRSGRFLTTFLKPAAGASSHSPTSHSLTEE